MTSPDGGHRNPLLPPSGDHRRFGVDASTHDCFVAMWVVSFGGRFLTDGSIAAKLSKDASVAPPQAETIMREALDLFRQGDPRAALSRALELSKPSQQEPFIAIEIAKFARAVGEREAMLAFGSTAHSGAISNAPIANTFAEMLLQEGRVIDALSVLAESFVASKDTVIVSHLRNVGRALESVKLGDVDRATVSRALAQLHEALGDTDLADSASMAEAALELSGFVGKNAHTMQFLAKAVAARAGGRDMPLRFDALGDRDMLLDSELHELLLALPEVALAIEAYAIGLERQGRLDDALGVVRAVIASTAATAETYLHAAALEHRTGSGATLVVLQAASERFPQSVAVAAERYRTALDMGDLGLAAIAAEQVFRAQPLDLTAGLNFVRVLTWNERFAEALDAAQGLLIHTSSAELLVAAAHAARSANRSDLALEYAAAAVERDPTNREFLNFFGELAVKQGQLELIGDKLDALLSDATNVDLAERAAQLLVQLISSRPKEYVDQRHIEQLQTLVSSNLTRLSTAVLWEVVLAANQLDLQDLASAVVTTAIDQTDLRDGPLPSPAVQFIERIAKRPLEGIGDPANRPRAAQLLLEAGLCATATCETWRADAAFRLAAGLAPENAAATINAAFSDLARGAVEQAWQRFGTVSRVYGKDMDFVIWPQGQSRRPWPHTPFEYTAAFEALKPSGADWPLITVITPSFNQCKYVEDTILSVLNQGYPRLQYIVVDGLSTDGSIDIIRRYELQLDAAIIEKDGGQTEAINKGLKRAKGEIITWLNSDDMLAPGALHIAALAWLRSQADLLFGICFSHSKYHFLLANLPAAEQETFTLQHLGEIFKYWMKGYFFYQPEVFFTRRILDAAGGTLDDSLYYTMDYKFWLQCAQSHARIERLHWPFAFFRQHEEQKTANLLDCMLEQADVRDRFVRIEPAASRRIEVRGLLRKTFDRRVVRVGVVSSRLEKIFSPTSARDLADALNTERFKVELVERERDLSDPDLVVKLIHLQGDVDELKQLRAGGYRGLILGWFWDNHHHLFDNFEVAEHLDIVLPGHAFASAYLRNRNAVHAQGVPLCITQWSKSEAATLFAETEDAPRDNGLYGGFVRYAFAKKRNNLIAALIQEGCDGVTFLEETNLRKYFGLSGRERFADWVSHKVSVCLPLAGDLSQRLFDALLAGQIPIVPADIHDLDAVIPPELQRRLPVVRFERYATDDVISAYRKALELFDRDGFEGVQRRHLYAVDGHTFPSRIGKIIKIAEELATQL